MAVSAAGMTAVVRASGEGKTAAEQFPPLAVGFRRRVLAGTAVAAVVAAGANFAGVTSSLLGLYPDLGRRLKLDTIYPIDGYSRCLDTDQGFEFMYPADWVGDQTLLYRAAERAEQRRQLDPTSPLVPAPQRRRRAAANEPAVAFGPPGSSGELNVSVIVSSVSPDFSIEAFGNPEEVGEAVLRTIAAARGGAAVTASLVNASVRRDPKREVNYYRLEFRVETPVFRRHNVAVCCSYDAKLYTLNAQAPESDWPLLGKQLLVVADSFSLT